MPILAAETDIYPNDLLTRNDLEEPSSDERPQWWAAYTRSRQEKVLMRGLRALEIPFYCPISARKYRSPAGRVRVSYLPVFANYVFMRCDGYDRYRALQTNLISKTIEVKDPTGLTHDLQQIQRLIQAGTSLRVEDKLVSGSRIRITAGPLRGICGVVVKREAEDYLFVAINFLQQGALVKLGDFEIEPLD